MKTLLFARTENDMIFDGSSKGTMLKLNGDTAIGAMENQFQFNKGFLELGDMPELAKSNAFTLEATVTPASVLGSRQNIMEGQALPAAFFIDDKGFLVGSVNLQSGGWQAVKSAAPLAAGKSQAVRFSRDASGKMTLDVDNANVGAATLPGVLVPVGTQGIRVGTWIDGSTYQFKGKIGDIRVSDGAVTADLINKRITNAKTLEAALKVKLGLNTKVVVFPSLDESQARLRPIKEIMNAAGVEKISDLSTLKITIPTAMTRGKVLIAPRKSAVSGINWGSIATGFKTLSAAEKKIQLAKFLPNRNSANTINSIADTAPATGITTTIPTTTRPLTSRIDNLSIDPRIGVRLSRETLALSPTIAALRRSTTLDEVIKLDNNKLTLVNKTELLKNLEAKTPANWPNLALAPKPMMLTTLPINTSVIIAGTLDLTNTQLVIEPDVEKLIIIAEKIILWGQCKNYLAQAGW